MARNRFTLDIPPSANRYWRVYRGRAVKSDEARNYQAAAGWLALSQGVSVMSGAVGIRLTVYRQRKSGDLDNYAKCLLDSLRGIAYEDDKQIVELHLYRRDDKKNPRVEIEVWEAA